MDSADGSGGVPTQAYRIGELSEATQLTRDTLRYYERLGLLAKTRRSPGGFRLYGRDAVAQVRFVKQAQALGLELGEIRQLAGVNGARGLAQCRQVQPVLRARLAELDTRLAELRGLRRTLRRALADCEERLASQPDAACPVVEELEERAARPRRTPRKTARAHGPRRRSEP